ncbi:MAG: CDGSH iron-sulfur domain-containing protein [Negativicutes bacterium]|jgi:CDGSH-type Zn-finger protein
MSEAKKQKLKVIQDGPYFVSGAIPLIRETTRLDSDNLPVSWEQTTEVAVPESYGLCRCGKSKSKPFCDGGHYATNFDGTETAVRENYLNNAKKYVGPGLELTDNEKLCSAALFCHRCGDAWTLTEHSGDTQSRDMAIEEAGNCPSGRLVAWDKATGKPIEPEFLPTISLLDDPAHNVSGPLWLKGGIAVEAADGQFYEQRNRVALCRCGQSANKPFCDGMHCKIEFRENES